MSDVPRDLLPDPGPERRFLLAAMRSLLHGRPVTEESVPRTFESWQRLFQAAADHRLIPLLYRYLASSTLAVPLPLAHALNTHVNQVAVRNRAAAAQLLELLGQLHAASIPVVSFKGPLLATTAYGDLAAREFSDLDLLVRRSDLQPAAFVLRCAGYRVDHPSRHAGAILSIGGEHHFPFIRDGAVPVEMHTAFAPAPLKFPLEESGIWDRIGAQPLLGQPVAALAHEDLILALCLHGAKHSWRCLEFVTGVAFLIRSAPALDWEVILAHARSLGGIRMLALGLALAEDWLHLPQPRCVRAAVASDPTFATLYRDALQRFVLEPDSAWGPRQRASFHWRCRERLQDRLCYLPRLAFTPNQEDFNWWPLARPFQLLYYPLRPLRLLITYAAGPGRRAKIT